MIFIYANSKQIASTDFFCAGYPFISKNTLYIESFNTTYKFIMFKSNKTDNDNQEELDEESSEGDEGKKKKGKKGLIIIIIAVLVLAGAGAGVYFSGILDGSSTSSAADDEVSNDDEPEEVDMNVVFYDLPEFLVNLNTNGKQIAFLKVTVTLEIANEADLEIVKTFEPRVIDSFNVYLREMRPSDLEGSGGIYRLKEALLSKINKEAYPARIRDILFKQMVLQ